MGYMRGTDYAGGYPGEYVLDEEDYIEQADLVSFIESHPAAESLQFWNRRTDDEQILDSIKMNGVERWFTTEQLWELVSIIDEVSNAPFWKKMIEDWFEKGGK